MAFELKKLKEKIQAHLKKRFLLIIREEDTFEEIETYKLTLLNVYILLSSVFFISGLGLLLLIIATPLKTYIPGYGNVRNTGEFIQLEKRLENLDKELKAREIYIDNFRRLLSNSPKTTADVTKDITINQEVSSPVPKVKEDSMLRDNFQMSNSKATITKTQTQPQRNINNTTLSIDKDLYDLAFAPPLRGTLGAHFGPDSDHFGIDIIAPENSPIKAVLSGMIIQSDWTLENGHTIAIQHANNLISVYKHNSALLKRTGTQVKSGEAIAIIGNTGTLTKGPHLHFEIWHKGTPVDPAQYIRF
ncbi:MAG: M23 family metallopeptidase [Saprospiraceae bacterium]|nr:M23 family metallopeptidase [Saprospiraceae bacterium]MBK9631587.1 M23 family metallopeptidase [Saprospiraceae bacterium]